MHWSISVISAVCTGVSTIMSPSASPRIQSLGLSPSQPKQKVMYLHTTIRNSTFWIRVHRVKNTILVFWGNQGKMKNLLKNKRQHCTALHENLLQPAIDFDFIWSHHTIIKMYRPINSKYAIMCKKMTWCKVIQYSNTYVNGVWFKNSHTPMIYTKSHIGKLW